MPLMPGNSQQVISNNIREMQNAGHPHNQSVAAALHNADRHPRDSGGLVPTLGSPTPSANTQNPIYQNMYQRYASMSPEQLQQLAVMMGGTPQGQMVQQVLQQKMMMGANQPQQQQRTQPIQQQTPSVLPQSPLAQTGLQPTQAHNGGRLHRDFGGDISTSEAMPWFERSEARSMYLNGSTGGRNDALNANAQQGSYVLPADVVSGIGEGNSLAGARILSEALKSGPWGTQQVPQRRGMGPPRAPAPYRDTDTPQMMNEVARTLSSQNPNPIAEAKRGGTLKDIRLRAGGVEGNASHIPVALSHGEFVISPQDVMRLGKGDIKRGHRMLDKFVTGMRQKHIQKLKKLPGPVK